MQIQTNLVGANFRPTEARETVRNLVIGERLVLQAEPTNAYDSNAVAIYAVFADVETGEDNYMHIGYVPKTDNAALAAQLAEGQEFDCTVTGFTGTLKPTLLITDEPD